MNIRFLTMLSGFALAALPFTCAATTINLSLDGDASVGSNYIDFNSSPTGSGAYTPAPGYGSFVTVAPVNGIFATNGVTLGEMGMIQSLNETPGPVTLPGAFITFDSGGSNLQLWATTINPGTVGPFNFSLSPTGVVEGATMSLSGYILDTTTGTQTATWSGTLAASFNNGLTPAQLEGSLPINTGFTGTFSATVTPTIPEPATFLLMGVGLIGAGLVARKKIRG